MANKRKNIGATLSLNNGNFFVNLKSAISGTNQLKGAASGATNALKKVGSGLAAAGAAVGKTVVAGFAASAAGMAVLTKKALDASGELEQNLGGSEAVFKEYAATLQGVGKTAYKEMGLSQSDFLATANKMGSLFQGAGFSIAESSDLSAKAMRRAADVASIMGIETGAAMESIAGAAKGNFTMMDNLGVAMNDTAIGAYAASKGIATATAKMTGQQKIGLAMEMFLEKTSYAAGNYAKENDTLAGSLTTAKAALTNFLSGAGGADEMVDSLLNVADVVSDKLLEIFPRLVTGLSDMVQKLAPRLPEFIQKLLPGVLDGAVKLVEGLTAALPAVIDVLIQSLPTVIPALVKSGVTLAQGVVGAVIENFPAILQGVGAGLSELFASLDMPELGGIFTGLLGGVSDLLPILLDLGKQLFPVVMQVADCVLSVAAALLPLITTLLPPLARILSTVVGALAPIITAILPPLTGILTTVLAALQPFIDLLAVLMDAIIPPLSQNLGFLAAVIGGAVGGALEVVKPLLDNLMGIFTGLIDFITGVFTGDWAQAWDGIKAIFGNVFEGLKNLFKMPINFIINGINAFIGGINSLKIPDWVPGVGGFSLNIPLIPLLAQGGVIRQSGRVMVGERGPEFLDLPRGAKVSPLDKSKGGNVFNITVNAGNKSAEEIIGELIPPLKLALANL
jgi:hypothetical protein